MKRLLFVSLAPPLPVTNGQRMRIWALLRALAAEGHDIHLLTFAQPQEISAYSDQLAGVCRSVEAVPHSIARWTAGNNYTDRFRALLSTNAYGIERFRSVLMAKQIVMRLEDRYDAVFMCSPFPAINLPNSIDVPLIIDEDSIEQIILQRYLLHERNPLRRAYGSLEWLKLRRWERVVCDRAALVLVCSENDRTIIKKMCPAVHTALVPNTIDVDDYCVSSNCDAENIVYVGCMDWFPNRDAVEFFIDYIWPTVRSIRPSARFTVVFSPQHAPPPGFRKRFFKTSGVEFLETTNVRKELVNATIFVVPLRIGSGTRFKILEAGALAKPIVSTRIGAEGLDFQSGKEIIVEDNPANFARAITELLAHSQMRAALGMKARDRVAREYSFKALRSTLVDALAILGSTTVRQSSSRVRIQKEHRLQTFV